MRFRRQGFTLVEVMIGIAIMAILLSIAVPSFSNASLGSQIRSLSGDLLAATSFARSEAIKRNTVVTLCASSNGTTCAGSGSWEQGWIVFSGTMLMKRDAAPTGFKVIAAGGATSILFQPTGVGATPESFKICRAAPNTGNQERVLMIDAAGRASSRRTTTGSCG